MSIRYRLNRMFFTSGRCLTVAADHGIHGDMEMLRGLEEMKTIIPSIISAGADAIHLTPGTAHILQEVAGRTKPALVLRADSTNVYGPRPSTPYCRLIGDAVDEGLRFDAACIIVNLLDLPDQPGLKAECIDNINKLRSECDRTAMPLMVMPLPMKLGSAGGYVADNALDRLIPLARMAAELGADVIESDPPEHLSDFHKVVKAAGVPVLARGGSKVPDDELMKRTQEVVKQGASGIVYGRNVIQHADPRKMTVALLALIHANASPEQALKILKG
ncbi:MAG: aldolase [Candidatus Coatesbacteria bacterium]